jgi:2-polyprenyl-3-methyl-5-hydroxy-6-metoxy-1,4-benzoquinol methylase
MRVTIFPDEYVSREGVLFPMNGEDGHNIIHESIVEKKLRAIIDSSSDLSPISTELRNKIADIDTLYHLTPRRANLLRPISSLLKGKILELGAGAGSITRFLGETGAEVIALEESPNLALIASRRTRDLNDVTIVCDNIQNMSIQEKFDIVTLANWPEYDKRSGSVADSTFDLLRNLRERLSPGGSLVLATPNKIGLKYLAGARENNTSIPFYGINDISEAFGVETFGREELHQILLDAGFKNFSWFYPFPDHRLPTTILAEAAFGPPRSFDLSALFAGSNFDDPKGARPGTFSLDQAWSLIARNGLTEDLANSFLVVCRTSDDHFDGPVTSPGELAWHYSVDRHPSFAKQAIFERGAKGDLAVKRSHLSGAPPPHLPLKLILENEEFIPGRLWSAELNRLMNRRGWTSEEIGEWLRFWIDAVLAAAECDPDADLQTTKVPGRFLDAMPFNMVRNSEGVANFIDLEWEAEFPLTMLQLSYRTMSKALGRITSCAEPSEKKHLLVVVLIKDVLKQVGIKLNISGMRDLEWEDRQLQYMVRNGVVGGMKPNIFKFYLRILKVRSRNIDGMVARAMRGIRKSVPSVWSRN